MSSKTTLSINYQLRKRNHALVAKGFEKICKKVSAGSKKLKSQHNLRAVRLPSKVRVIAAMYTKRSIVLSIIFYF